jgi:predicted Zn finger-like uncharacterized protein
MSLITSCPACGTMFRVVPDQLRISEGWVRCGHCAEIFDASAHLTDETAVAAARQQEQPVAPQPPEPAASPPEFTPPAAPQRVPEPQSTLPAELATRPAELYGGRGQQQRRATEAAGPPSSSFGPESESLEPSPLDRPFVFRRSDLVDTPDPSVQPPPPRDSQLHADEADEPSPAEIAAVSFVRQARRKALWRRPLVRIALVLASFALAAALLVQMAYHDRDRLALAEPGLRPALDLMCQALQCRIGPPRQIEAIVIENSGFNRVRNDTYRLAFTLRNTANVQVAVPAMELTITDAQDQPIARRVLMPAEFGAHNDVLSPVTDWSRSVGLVVTAPPPARIAGYRLLAFYP